MEEFRRVDLEYRLVREGIATPTTQAKAWFFAVPRARDNDTAWLELLHRLFYDANVALQRRERNDPSWLALDSYRVSPLDPAHLLDWNGQTDETTARAYLPWFLSARAVVWEGSACWIVDETGRYDGLSPYDYSELMLSRTANPAGEVSFLDKLYPGKGKAIYDDRAQRLANIPVIRDLPPGVFRKAPGAGPVASGPPLATHLS